MKQDSERFDRAISAVAGSLIKEQNRQEIERAVDRVKHPKTARDKWWRRQWYRAAAIRGWPNKRRALPKVEQCPTARRW
jgi:hypothetical protein